MAEVHRILKEMYIGMAVCMIVFLAIGAFFMRPYYIFALALLVGNLGGHCAFIISMMCSIRHSIWARQVRRKR